MCSISHLGALKPFLSYGSFVHSWLRRPNRMHWHHIVLICAYCVFRLEYHLQFWCTNLVLPLIWSHEHIMTWWMNDSLERNGSLLRESVQEIDGCLSAGCGKTALVKSWRSNLFFLFFLTLVSALSEPACKHSGRLLWAAVQWRAQGARICCPYMEKNTVNTYCSALLYGIFFTLYTNLFDETATLYSRSYCDLTGVLKIVSDCLKRLGGFRQTSCFV